jgi:hypothetical protein
VESQTTRRSFLHRHRKWSALAVILLTPVAGALAYFALSGAAPVLNTNGGSTAASGGSAIWTTTASAPTPVGGLLSPGSGSEVVSVTVTNSNTVAQTGNDNNVTGVLQTIGSDAVDASTHADIAGCLASWFTLTRGSDVNQSTLSVPAGGTLNALEGETPTFTLTMPANAVTNQNVCEGHPIAIAVSFFS